MTPEIFKIKKAIAIANLTVEFYKSVNRLITAHSGNNVLLEPMLYNLKKAYDLRFSLIKSATYENYDEGPEFINVWQCPTCKHIMSDLAMQLACYDYGCTKCKTPFARFYKSHIKSARYEDHDETRLYTNQQIRPGNKKIGNGTSHQK